MDLLRSIILGVIQGLTEFLPVSSSGHLEIAKFILGDDSVGQESLLMTVVLHVATALSTLVIFRKDILEIIRGLFHKTDNEHRFFTAKIILSMLPAAFVGVFFDEQIEQLFTRNLVLVGTMLLVTAAILFLADRSKSNERNVGFLDSLIIGTAQAIAIMPGISRSGATIGTSVLLGIDKEKSARFSFLMVVPLIFGKIAKDLLDGDVLAASHNYTNLSVGFIAAFITGLFACTWMIKIVKKSELKYFAFYCMIVGLGAIIYTLF